MTVSLSEREQQVYDLHIRGGHTARVVAGWLQLSRHTIRRHAESIRAKFAADGQPLPDKRRHFITH